MIYTFETLFLYFIIYSFVGWTYESILCSILEKKIVNRGFLTAPICPIYGFGAMASVILLYGKTDNLLYLFLGGMIFASIIEYFTAFILEKLFHAKWWDYSDRKFNLNGRICLIGALVFGILSVLIITYVHPLIISLVSILPTWLKTALTIFFTATILSDTFATVFHLIDMNKKLKEIQFSINTLIKNRPKLPNNLKNSKFAKEKIISHSFLNDKIKTAFIAFSSKRFSRFQQNRLVAAFPKFKSVIYADAFKGLKEHLKEKPTKTKKDSKKES